MPKKKKNDDGDYTSVTFSCRKCNFSTNSYGSVWRKHLLEDRHQIETRLNVKHLDLKVKKRTLVVFGISAVKVKDVLKYLGDFATVTDFTFWKERRDFCIVTVLHPQSRDVIIRCSHAINEKRLFLRALDEIPVAEWVSICPFASTNVEMEGELEEDSPVDVFGESSEDEDPPDDVDMNNEEHSFSTFSSLNNDPCTNGISFRTSIFDAESTVGTAISDDDDTSSVATVPLATIVNREREKRKRARKEDLEEDDSDGIEIVGVDLGIEQQQISNNQRATGAGGTHDCVLNEIMEDFYDQNLMNPSLWKLRSIITQEMTVILQNDFPNCVVFPFGIACSGLSSREDALNLFVDLARITECNERDRVITIHEDAETTSALVHKIYCRLQQFQSSYGSISHLTKGGESGRLKRDRVGFVYTTLKQEKVQCWIQASNFPTVQHSRILNFCIKLDDRVRPLLIIFHHWAHHHNLLSSNPGPNDRRYCFHYYVLQWLVIHFLSYKNILPPIELLKTNAPTRLLHCGDNIGFCNDTTKLGWAKKTDFPLNPVTGNPSAKHILELATELFDHCVGFAQLNLESNPGMVSVSLGRLVNRNELIVKNPFSSSLSWEQSKALLGTKKEIIIQHPLNLSHNMARNVKDVATQFCTESAHTAHCLREVLRGGRQMLSPIPALELRAPPHNKASKRRKVEANLHDSPASSLSRSPTVQNEVTTDGENEDSSARASQAAQIHIPKQNRFKDFEIQLNIDENIKGLNNADLRKLRTHWCKIFKRFNRFVWPTCFGVDLLTTEEDTPPQDLSPPWETILEPYLGVVDNVGYPKILKSFALKPHYLTKRLKLKKLSNKLWNRKSPHLQSRARRAERDKDLLMKETKFSFHCCHSAKETKRTKEIGVTIRLQFTNVLFENDKFRNFKNNIIGVYQKLWEGYVHRTILQWKSQKKKKNV